jgi:hypothetical protein
MTCPLCHTVAAGVTDAGLSAGTGWRCATCDQRWDAARLTAVAGYAQFVADRARLAQSPELETRRRG